MKDFGNKFTTNVAQINWLTFWAILKIHFLSLKLILLLFGNFLKKIGLRFIKTSGHTTNYNN